MPATLELVALIALAVGALAPPSLWWISWLAIRSRVDHESGLAADGPLRRPVALWGYFTAGRLSTKRKMMESKARGEKKAGTRKPFWEQAALATTHCGSGCTLADIMVESILAAVPLTIFGHAIFGSWAVDYAAALLFGLVFQYFTIVPMRHLSPEQGIWAPRRPIFYRSQRGRPGMYGWMAIAVLCLVPSRTGEDGSPVLVHDASCHAGRILHVLSRQLAAASLGTQRSDVAILRAINLSAPESRHSPNASGSRARSSLLNGG